MKLYAFHCGGNLAKRAMIDPLDDRPADQVYEPHFFYLIQHREGNVLFDTGMHPELLRDPDARSVHGDRVTIEAVPDHWAVVQLASVGVSPDEVHRVVLSHLHYDHAGGLASFPNAQALVQRRELGFAHWPPSYQQAIYAQRDFQDHRRWHAVDGVHDVFGDGKVVAFPAPGHTPGHQALFVDVASQPVVLVGDAAMSLEKLRRRRLPAMPWSPDAMLSTWTALEAMERRYGAVLLCSHEQEYKTRVRVAPGEWYE